MYEGYSKSSKTNSKKKSEYGNQIESCKYSHLIWFSYSEFFLEFVLELFECPSYSKNFDLKKGVIEKISYERRAYESVDDRSHS